MKAAMGRPSRVILTLAIGFSLMAHPNMAEAREISVTKKCSKTNDFNFSVDWERNMVDFDFDIKRDEAFDDWSFRIARNGEVLVRGRDSADEDGDLSREFVRRGQLTPGERWSFVARSESGNICRASFRF
jgi:hypothetical protein